MDTDDYAGASWKPIDLGPYLRGDVTRPKPSIGIARRDGLRLLYPGKEHTVMGEMESGKTWLCAACVAAELTHGRDVIYIHFEEADPLDIVQRLQTLGVHDGMIDGQLRFVGPNQPIDPYALAALLDPAPSLVVLDGVNEAMALHSMGIREEDGAAAFRRRLVKPFTAAGAAVLGADHVVKDHERRDRSPLGSIHKGNGLTGSLILLENAEPFGRGRHGCSHVFVTKDRPGYLRREGRADKRKPGKFYMGSLIVDDTSAWDLDLAFIEPQPAEEDGTTDSDPHAETDRHVLETVRELHAAGKTATTRAVRAKAKLGNEKAADALTRLALSGELTESTGPRGSRIFAPVDRSRGPVPIEGDQNQTTGSGPRTGRDQSGPVGDPA